MRLTTKYLLVHQPTHILNAKGQERLKMGKEHDTSVFVCDMCICVSIDACVMCVWRRVCVFLNWRLCQAAAGCECAARVPALASCPPQLCLACQRGNTNLCLLLWTTFLIFWSDSCKEEWVQQVEVKICERIEKSRCGARRMSKSLVSGIQTFGQRFRVFFESFSSCPNLVFVIISKESLIFHSLENRDRSIVVKQGLSERSDICQVGWLKVWYCF